MFLPLENILHIENSSRNICISSLLASAVKYRILLFIYLYSNKHLYPIFYLFSPHKVNFPYTEINSSFLHYKQSDNLQCRMPYEILQSSSLTELCELYQKKYDYIKYIKTDDFIQHPSQILTLHNRRKVNMSNSSNIDELKSTYSVFIFPYSDLTTFTNYHIWLLSNALEPVVFIPVSSFQLVLRHLVFYSEHFNDQLDCDSIMKLFMKIRKDYQIPIVIYNLSSHTS